MTKWQVRFDEEVAIFQRPLAERLWSGGVAAVMDCLFVAFVVSHHRLNWANCAALISDGAFLLLITLGIGHRAGPKEMRFDFKRREYQWRIGLPLLSWKHTGGFDEIASLSFWNLTKFTGLTVEWKNAKRMAFTFAECSTGCEAQELAERLVAKIGVPAKKGNVLGLKRTAKTRQQ